MYLLLTRNNKPVHCTVCPPVSDTQLTSLKQILLERGGFIACTQIRNHFKKKYRRRLRHLERRINSLSQGRIYYRSAELALVGF